MASVLYELSLMEAGVEVSYVSQAASMQQLSNVAQMYFFLNVHESSSSVAAGFRLDVIGSILGLEGVVYFPA